MLKAAGHDVDDVNYAILTYADGAVVNLGVATRCPKNIRRSATRRASRVLGTDGVMIDDDHTDPAPYTRGRASPRLSADHTVNMVFLQSGTPGDWALGEFWGPI